MSKQTPENSFNLILIAFGVILLIIIPLGGIIISSLIQSGALESNNQTSMETIGDFRDFALSNPSANFSLPFSNAPEQNSSYNKIPPVDKHEKTTNRRGFNNSFCPGYPSETYKITDLYNSQNDTVSVIYEVTGTPIIKSTDFSNLFRISGDCYMEYRSNSAKILANEKYVGECRPTFGSFNSIQTIPLSFTSEGDKQTLQLVCNGTFTLWFGSFYQETSSQNINTYTLISYNKGENWTNSSKSFTNVSRPLN